MSAVHKEQPIDITGETLSEGRSLAWWGMVFFIASEALLFANLIAGYLYLRVRAGTWPPPGTGDLNDITLPIINTVILLSSSIPIRFAGRAAASGQMRRAAGYISLTVALGVIFLSLQAVEYSSNNFGITAGVFGSTFYAITGLHGAHVAAGIIFLVVNFFRTLRGQLTKEKHFSLVAGEMYWHFVDVVWIFVFSLVYLITVIKF